jgi:predicted TIM-barrel fold metal-dependent hydrolase
MADKVIRNRNYSPDVEERKTLDNSFSSGLGFHFLPSEEYWFDMHVHLKDAYSLADIRQALAEWFGILDGYRLEALTLLVEEPALFAPLQEIMQEDERVSWMYYLHHDKADIDLVKQALDCGAAGLKLHNAPIMRGQAERTIWFTDQWQEIFAFLQEKKKSILWHVTQRTSRSPYHGGSENPYWSENKTKTRGTFDNETLLQDFLSLVEKYPGIYFIGAHQLHLGLDRLASELDRYDNLYIDSSCSFFLRWADQLYPEDRETYLEFFRRYKDRILFGSDASLAPGQVDNYLIQSFLGHARFVLQLQLPDDILQAVAWQNAQRLIGLNITQVQRRGNVRP